MSSDAEIAPDALADLLFNEAGVARCLVSSTGRVVRTSTAWVRYTGGEAHYSPDEPPPDLPATIGEYSPDAIARARTGHVLEVALHVSPAGSDRWWSGTIVPLDGHRGPTVLISLRELSADVRVALESAERKAAECWLHSSRLESLISTIPAGVIVSDADRHVTLVNAQAQAMLGGLTGDAGGPDGGYTLHDARGGPFPSDDLPLVRALAGETVTGVELTVRRGGDECVLLASGAPVRDRDGASAGAVAVLQDITARKRTETALQEREERYRTLFANMTEGFALGECLTDDGGHPIDIRLLEMNDAFERQTGLSREQTVGRPVRSMLPQLEQSWIDTYCAVALGAGPARFESYNRDLDRHFSVYCFSPRPQRFAVLFSDVTERKQWEERLAAAARDADEERRRLAAVLEALPAGVGIADLNGRITHSNEALKRIWGNPPNPDKIEDYAVYRGWWVDSGRPLQKEDWALERALATDEIVPGDIVEIERFDGTGRATIINAAAPIHDADGRIVGGVIAEVDITAQMRAEAALREAARRKDEFIAILSHELRNPLAPIRFALPFLRRAPLPEPAERALAVIERQIGHLERLVDDLLDSSRISRGKLELRRRRVTVASIVTAAIESAAPATSAARHEVQVRLADEPMHIRADAARLTQVVTNLINNSAKYTRRGGRIEIEVRREDGSATIAVRDNGIGIPADALPHVFDMFRQVNSPDRPQGGLGIGLGLSRRLVEMHGGTIEAQSEGTDRGAEFIVRLPLMEPVAASPVEAAVPRRERPLRVLIVDDNPDLVEMLGEVVASLGHDVRKALDGGTAVAAAAAYRPDVVLLDVGLPVMSGLDVARAIRQQPDIAGAVLIAITGWGEPDDRLSSREAGFDHHLTKPIDPDTLIDLLAGLS